MTVGWASDWAASTEFTGGDDSLHPNRKPAVEIVAINNAFLMARSLKFELPDRHRRAQLDTFYVDDVHHAIGKGHADRGGAGDGNTQLPVGRGGEPGDAEIFRQRFPGSRVSLVRRRDEQLGAEVQQRAAGVVVLALFLIGGVFEAFLDRGGDQRAGDHQRQFVLEFLGDELIHVAHDGPRVASSRGLDHGLVAVAGAEYQNGKGRADVIGLAVMKDRELNLHFAARGGESGFQDNVGGWINVAAVGDLLGHDGVLFDVDVVRDQSGRAAQGGRAFFKIARVDTAAGEIQAAHVLRERIDVIRVGAQILHV